MSKYTVKKGASYKASFKLGGFESLASNEMIKGKLVAAGFSNVKVWGSGGVRYATGDWEREDASAELPSQVHQIIRTDD